MSEENNNSPDSKQTMIFIAIIVLAIFLFKGGGCSPISLGGDDTSTSDALQQDTIQDDLYDSDDDTINHSDNNGYVPPTINACGFSDYGLPDYSGTPDAGKDCADFISAQRDLECLSSPPSNYDGLISVPELTSNPIITCCGADGTCQW